MSIQDEKEILREWVKHPGTKIMAEKLRQIAKATIREQLDYDPYSEPERIMKAKQLRYVIKVVIPEILEKIINYQEPITKPKWSILKLFRR